MENEYSECKVPELKFEKLTEGDLEVLKAYAKKSPAEIIGGVSAAIIGLILLVWAWVFSQNGLGYSIAFSLLTLIIFYLAWLWAGKKNIKAVGVAKGVINSSRYESAKNGEACDAVDYYATVIFGKSNQKITNLQVPRILSVKENCPKEGTEIDVFKLSDKKYILVYPEYKRNQKGLTYKC